MASETVKKILEAEALADRKTSEARQRRDDVINDAQGKAALTVQKSLTEASKESGRIKAELEKKLDEYRAKAGQQCEERITEIRSTADKNMSRAVEAIISEYF